MIIDGEGRLTLQWMQPCHTADMVDLFRCCYSMEHWTAKDFTAFEHSRKRRSTIKVLTNSSQTVLAALMYTLEDSCCRIRRIAVWPDYRNRGLATYMLNSLCSPRSLLKKTQIVARVPENNMPAVRLFIKTMGFSFDPSKPRASVNGYDQYEFTFHRSKTAATVAV